MNIQKATKKNLVDAGNIIKNGGIAIYPTETVYGLGCDPFNIKAIERLLNIKGKDRSKPLPVLAASLHDVAKIAVVSPNGKLLAAKFWPGSVTMIFFKKPELPNIVTFGLDSVGLRIPNHEVAIELLSLCGGLLIGSSANITGKNPPRNIREIPDQLMESVDIVIDGGHSIQGRPSTVVDLTLDKPKIIREGPISRKQILETLAFGN